LITGVKHTQNATFVDDVCDRLGLVIEPFRT
jgi:hypothetical protein